MHQTSFIDILNGMKELECRYITPTELHVTRESLHDLLQRGPSNSLYMDAFANYLRGQGLAKIAGLTVIEEQPGYVYDLCIEIRGKPDIYRARVPEIDDFTYEVMKRSKELGLD